MTTKTTKANAYETLVQLCEEMKRSGQLRGALDENTFYTFGQAVIAARSRTLNDAADRSYDRKFAELYLDALKPTDIVSVYSGKNGKCCCGCSGKHSYESSNAAIGTERRGYKVDDDDINDKMVRRVLNIMQTNASTVVFGQNNISIVIGERLYVVYPVKLDV